MELANLKKLMTGRILNSDWYSAAPGFYNGVYISESTGNTGDPMFAHSGTHYIGFGP